MKLPFSLSLALLPTLLLSSCFGSKQILELTVAGNKSADIHQLHQYKTDEYTRVGGNDRIYFISFIPTGKVSLDRALDDALKNAGPGAVALRNVAVENSYFIIPYVYGQASFTITGNPVYLPDYKPTPQTP